MALSGRWTTLGRFVGRNHAILVDPNTEKGKIVAGRIGRAERAAASSKLLHRFPVILASGEQSKAAGLSSRVHIEREDELGRRDAVPEAEVHRAWPDHPSGVHREAFARAAGGRAREVLCAQWGFGRDR